MTTSVRSSPSGPRVNVGGADAPFAERYQPDAPIPLSDGTPANIVANVVPLPADAPGPRLALVTVALALVNSAGFAGAPFVVPVGLTRNAEVPINMGAARSTPTGPGLAGAGTPVCWTQTNVITVNPGDSFTLFARSVDGGGGVGAAATVVPFPLEQDAATTLTFLFP